MEVRSWNKNSATDDGNPSERLIVLSLSPPTSGMEEETEVLDWGNELEEDETRGFADASRGLQRHRLEDAEDAISLGSDDAEQAMDAADSRGYPSTTNGRASTPKSVSISHGNLELSPRHSAKSASLSQSSPQQSPHHSLSASKLTHALPPKPVASSVPFVHVFDTSVIEATAMSRRTDRDRDKKSNGSTGKPPQSAQSSESGDKLPPDWEIRHPRSGGRGVYYYNVRTHE